MPSVPVYILAFAVLWGSPGLARHAQPPPHTTSGRRIIHGATGWSSSLLVRERLPARNWPGIRTMTGTYLGVFPWVVVLAIIGFFVAFVLMRPLRPKTR